MVDDTDQHGDDEEVDLSSEARINQLTVRVAELEHQVRALVRVVKPDERRWWRDFFG